MTPAERAKPEIIDARPKARIANGSGTDIAQVNRLLKQFQDMKKMMHIMTKGKGETQPNGRPILAWSITPAAHHANH